MSIDWNKLQPPKLFNETYFSETYGSDVTLTITDVRVEEVGKDAEEKAVMRFHETALGFVVNRTNRQVLQEKLGRDSDTWRGARVTLTLKREGIRVTQAVPATSGDEAPF
jgi:hypothetical protein